MSCKCVNIKVSAAVYGCQIKTTACGFLTATSVLRYAVSLTEFDTCREIYTSAHQLQPNLKMLVILTTPNQD